MSIWTEVSGIVSVHKSEHISIRKLLNESFNEVVIEGIDSELHPCGDFHHRIDFRFSDDGDTAFNLIQKFLNKFKGKTGFYCDIDVSTRFVR